MSRSVLDKPSPVFDPETEKVNKRGPSGPRIVLFVAGRRRDAVAGCATVKTVDICGTPSTLEGSVQSACISGRRLSVYRVIAFRRIPIGISMTDRTANETVRTLVNRHLRNNLKAGERCQQSIGKVLLDRRSTLVVSGMNDDESSIILCALPLG